MGNYVRTLTLICQVVLLMGGVLEAQQKLELQPIKEVIVGVMVLQVDREVTDSEPTLVTSGSAAKMLNAFLSDAATKPIRRSQLRASDGITSIFKAGNDQPCPSATGPNLEITPRIYSAQKLTLHVVVSEDANPGCAVQPATGRNMNEFDISLHDGQVSILGGLKPPNSSDVRSRLVIALIPEIVHNAVVAR